MANPYHGHRRSFTLRHVRADEVSDPAGPPGRPTRGDGAGAPAPSTPLSPDELIAEYDDERPARRLAPRLDRVVVALCFLTSVFVPITKLMFDRKADLEKVHPAAKELDPKVAVDTAPVELAPGARTAVQGLGAR